MKMTIPANISDELPKTEHKVEIYKGKHVSINFYPDRKIHPKYYLSVIMDKLLFPFQMIRYRFGKKHYYVKRKVNDTVSIGRPGAGKTNGIPADISLHTAVTGTAASGESTPFDMKSLRAELEKTGTAKIIDMKNIPSHCVTFDPFASMYDILGEERQIFIEKLAEITEFAIIEENDLHTRIMYKRKEHGYTEEEFHKLHSDFFTLKNSMKVQIRIVPEQKK